MASFALILNGYVTNVTSISDSDCSGGILPEADITGNRFLQSLGFSGEWKLTSITGLQRYNYAGIGYTYDTARDAFIEPNPYPSWVLDENVMRWFAPVPRPSEGSWVWDESTVSWIPCLPMR